MAAPLKPWERAGTNYQHNSSLPSNSMACGLPDQDRLSAIGATASPCPQASSPPRIPPRPTQQSSYQSRFNSGMGYGGLGGFNSYSSPLGYGSYGGLYSSPYSSYGGYGPNRFNDSGGSAFARHAEESSRPAFESIESIVHAVTSVGMMLDSTFQAVYSSFRAVIGVADNFSRLKSQLLQVISALAFIRTLRYLFRRLLELLRLKPAGEAERQWKKAFREAAASAAVDPSGGAPKKSTWPILMFFGIIMGGPYLIWKLISTFSGASDENGWAKGKEDHFLAQALFSFQGQSTEEISFSQGEFLKIAPKEIQPRVRGWLLASRDGEKTGLVPANYVKVLGKKRGTNQINEAQSQIQKAEPSFAQNLEVPSGELSDTSHDNFENAFISSKVPYEKEENFGDSIDKQDQEAADILSEVDKS